MVRHSRGSHAGDLCPSDLAAGGKTAIRTTQDADGSARVTFVVARIRDQDRDPNINSKYIVDTVEVKGVPDRDISPDLRQDLQTLTGKPVELGSGEFFGELALLTGQPRNADVVSLGYCRLLELSSRDFQDLLAGDADLKRAIEAVAAERMHPRRGGQGAERRVGR